MNRQCYSLELFGVSVKVGPGNVSRYSTVHAPADLAAAEIDEDIRSSVVEIDVAYYVRMMNYLFTVSSPPGIPKRYILDPFEALGTCTSPNLISGLDKDEILVWSSAVYGVHNKKMTLMRVLAIHFFMQGPRL
jgi:hypothetical protein